MNAHDAIKDALIALAILNFFVSVAVVRSAAYSGRQKIMQILIIWLVPVMGGVLLGLFMLIERGKMQRIGYPTENSDDVGQIWSGLHPPDHRH